MIPASLSFHAIQLLRFTSSVNFRTRLIVRVYGRRNVLGSEDYHEIGMTFVISGVVFVPILSSHLLFCYGEANEQGKDFALQWIRHT